MARMLGRYLTPGCCPGTRDGRRPGPDCSGGAPMGTRAAKRAEARTRLRELADRGFVPGLYEDHSDCRHGCNGSPCGSEQCTFICHPETS